MPSCSAVASAGVTREHDVGRARRGAGRRSRRRASPSSVRVAAGLFLLALGDDELDEHRLSARRAPRCGCRRTGRLRTRRRARAMSTSERASVNSSHGNTSRTTSSGSRIQKPFGIDLRAVREQRLAALVQVVADVDQRREVVLAIGVEAALEPRRRTGSPRRARGTPRAAPSRARSTSRRSTASTAATAARRPGYASGSPAASNAGPEISCTRMWSGCG